MIPLSLDQIATIVGGTLNEAADPHTVVTVSYTHLTLPTKA